VNSKVIALRGYTFARMGRTEQAHDVLETLRSIAQERYVPPYAMALVYMGLRRYDDAMDWLERCYSARDVHVVFLPIDAKWDPLRNDVRFPALLRQCGIAG
jgi:hypothetical protein